MFGTEPWGYGGYGQFHVRHWIDPRHCRRGRGGLAPIDRFHMPRGQNRNGAVASAVPVNKVWALT